MQALQNSILIGYAAYVLCGTVLTIWLKLYESEPGLLFISIVVYFFSGIFQYYFYYADYLPLANHLKKRESITHAFGRFHGFYWGAISTYLIFFSSLTDDQNHIILLIMVVIAAMGSFCFGFISHKGLIWALITLAPYTFCNNFLFFNNQTLILDMLLLVLAIFISLSNRLVDNNYARLLEDQKLAQLQANSMEVLSKKDFLTKLNNRFSFLLNYEMAWENSVRNSQPLCLICIDVNNLRKINVQYGHEAGDQVLISLANALKSVMSVDHLLARYAGDKFLIALPDSTLDICKKISQAISIAVKDSPAQHKKKNIPYECTVASIEAPPELHVNPMQAIDFVIKGLLKAKQDKVNNFYAHKITSDQLLPEDTAAYEQ